VKFDKLKRSLGQDKLSQNIGSKY